MTAGDIRAAPTIAWFHCFSGIAGDMALGALLDAGADLGEVRAMLARLPVGGWSLDVEPVLRCGIAATKAQTTICNDAGCTMNISGMCHRRGVDTKVRHIAELMAEAMGIEYMTW